MAAHYASLGERDTPCARLLHKLPSIMLSGFQFPCRGMPQWVQWIGAIIPVTHMLRVLRGAMLIADVLPDLGVLALFVLIVATLAINQYRQTLD
jgi:ABC-2 type transport system permease protein